MQPGNPRIAVVLILAGLLVGSCARPEAEPAVHAPIAIEPIEGTDLARITLSEKAAERLDIQTAPVREEAGAGGQRTSVPFAAVVYGPRGDSWVYTSPEPLVFVRHATTILRIEEGVAVLSDGPVPGTVVVTTGAAELYGAETGVGGY